MIDRTHDPDLRSWVESAKSPATDFPVQNLPLVTFRNRSERRSRAGTAIGDYILDLTTAFRVDSVRSVMAMPKADRVELRRKISDFLTTYTPRSEAFLTLRADTELQLP